jgi:hypothetical protein
LADCSVQASSSGCRACSECSNPQAVNLVTIGMAIVNKRRRNQSVHELKTLLKSYLPNQEEPTTLRIAAYKPGPGSELRKMLAWFARPSDTCKCETRAETMNDWGVEGCRTNLDTIIEWLLEEAQLRGPFITRKLAHGKFTRTIAKSLVLTAIRRFERKFPDGAPEPNEDDPDTDEEDR